MADSPLSFRLKPQEIAALKEKQQPGESNNQTAQRLLREMLGTSTDTSTALSTIDLDSKIREVVQAEVDNVYSTVDKKIKDAIADAVKAEVDNAANKVDAMIAEVTEKLERMREPSLADLKTILPGLLDEYFKTKDLGKGVTAAVIEAPRQQQQLAETTPSQQPPLAEPSEYEEDIRLHFEYGEHTAETAALSQYSGADDLPILKTLEESAPLPTTEVEVEPAALDPVATEEDLELEVKPEVVAANEDIEPEVVPDKQAEVEANAPTVHKRRTLNQKQLAAELGVNESTLSRAKPTKENPNGKPIKKLGGKTLAELGYRFDTRIDQYVRIDGAG